MAFVLHIDGLAKSIDSLRLLVSLVVVLMEEARMKAWMKAERLEEGEAMDLVRTVGMREVGKWGEEQVLQNHNTAMEGELQTHLDLDSKELKKQEQNILALNGEECLTY